MKLFPDDHETIAGTARRLRQGEVTCEGVLQSCLDRIEQREHEVRAWVIVDRDGALVQARDLDAELQAGRDRGPLHGIPIGVKDIIDVEGLPTGCGSLRGTGRLALEDATIVTRLRDAGAVILGKTVTTAYGSIPQSAAIPGASTEPQEDRRAARPRPWPAACAWERSALKLAARSPGQPLSAASPE